MNGTIYEEIKKNGDSKKREKLKFFITILSTNILVATLCLSFAPTVKEVPSLLRKTKLLHPHFKMIVVPLTVLVDIDLTSSETPVTLMNKSKKILISKAYLHEMLASNHKDLESPRFKIEIPEEEVQQISADDSDAMIAIPEIKMAEKGKLPLNKRVSKYETNL